MSLRYLVEENVLAGSILLPWIVAGSTCLAAVSLGAVRGYTAATGAPTGLDAALYLEPIGGAALTTGTYALRDALWGKAKPCSRGEFRMQGFVPTIAAAFLSEGIGFGIGYVVGRY